MRTIKFRAFHREARQMRQVEQLDFRPVYLSVSFTQSIELRVEREDDLDITVFENCPLNEVELMQFTGLLDKNGKEIYEGDIIQYEFNEGSKGHGEIQWSKRNAAFSIPYGSDGWEHNLSGVVSLKVIGNTYENPELLKG